MYKNPLLTKFLWAIAYYLLLNLLIFSILNPSYAQSNPNPSTAIDNFITNQMNTKHFAGVSTVMVKGGEIVWLESYGLADVPNNIPVEDTTIFMLASVSKLFTGTALMQLYKDGEINSLDEPINNYLPFSITVPNHAATPITFRHLLTHTSGIKDNDNVTNQYYSTGDPTITLAACMERYFCTCGTDYRTSGNFYNRAPGSGYDYTNMGTALIGYLVERIAQMPFEEYCETNLFNPACMDKTAWHLSDLNIAEVALPHQYKNGNYTALQHYGFADYPNGQLRSNVVNLANYMLTFLQNGSFDNRTVLDQSIVSSMLTPQVPELEAEQGLSWYKETLYPQNGPDKEVWGHNGGEDGVTTDLYIHLGDNIGIAVLANNEGDLLPIIDKLYDYALTLNVSGQGNPSCEMTINSCTDILNIDDKPIPAKAYKANDKINATGTIAGGTSVAFQAGTAIYLKSGFEASAGATFSAIIKACSSTNFKPAPPINLRENTSKKVEVEHVANSSLKVFPNPITPQQSLNLVVSGFDTFVNIHLMDINGRLIQTFEKIDTTLDHLAIPINHLEQGIYFLRVMDGTNLETIRVVVQ